MKKALSIAVLMVLAATVGVALAGGNSNPDKKTNFVPPTFTPSNTDCQWTWVSKNHPANSPAPAPHDPQNTCIGGTQDAYSYSIAWGMQIESYSWAKDTCSPGSAGASSAAASAGNV